MDKNQRYEMICDLKKRIHIVEGELKHIIDYLEIIEEEADELVINGNAKLRGGESIRPEGEKK